jgi:SP family sugar:H+ symporter-like MFS transporter
MMRHSLRPGEATSQNDVVHNETDRGHFGKDVDYNRERVLSDDTSSEHSAQAGVKRIEAVSKAWTKTSLIVAYVTYVISITFHHGCS